MANHESSPIRMASGARLRIQTQRVGAGFAARTRVSRSLVNSAYPAVSRITDSAGAGQCDFARNAAWCRQPSSQAAVHRDLSTPEAMARELRQSTRSPCNKAVSPIRRRWRALLPLNRAGCAQATEHGRMVEQVLDPPDTQPVRPATHRDHIARVAGISTRIHCDRDGLILIAAAVGVPGRRRMSARNSSDNDRQQRAAQNFPMPDIVLRLRLLASSALLNDPGDDSISQATKARRTCKQQCLASSAFWALASRVQVRPHPPPPYDSGCDMVHVRPLAERRHRIPSGQARGERCHHPPFQRRLRA